MIGLGWAPMGTSLVGLGSVDVATISTPQVLIKPDGTQGDAPALTLNDDGLLDYVVSDSGQKIGADSIGTMVLLALRTTRGSSALLDFGLDLSALRARNANATQAADTAVRSALSDLISKRLIAIVSISFQPVDSSSGVIRLVWIDLTTQTKQTTSLALGSQ